MYFFDSFLSAYLLPARALCSCFVHFHFPPQTCMTLVPGTPELPVAGRPRWCNTHDLALAGLAQGWDETALCPPNGSMSAVYCWTQEIDINCALRIKLPSTPLLINDSSFTGTSICVLYLTFRSRKEAWVEFWTAQRGSRTDSGISKA